MVCTERPEPPSGRAATSEPSRYSVAPPSNARRTPSAELLFAELAGRQPTAPAGDDIDVLIARLDRDVATLFLDGELRVRRASPQIEPLFGIAASDVGRKFSLCAPDL